MSGKSEESRLCVCGFGEQFFTIEGDRRLCTVCGGGVGLPDAPPAEKQRPAKPAPAPVEAGGKLVLVIDDQSFFRDRIREMLARKGHIALVAENGMEGIKKVADVYVRHEPDRAERIDAVLLDMIMPGELDGMQTLSIIKRIVPELPVLVLTANPPTRELLQKLAQSGARKYLNKSSSNLEALILKNI
jgi:CheY-like chemotaxis protein